MREFEPEVKESLEGLVEDFRQALLNECEAISSFGGFEKINFITLDSAVKIIPTLLCLVVETQTLSCFGEKKGDLLNKVFNISADKRITIALAENILETLGEKIPEDMKKRIEEVLKRLRGELGETHNEND